MSRRRTWLLAACAFILPLLVLLGYELAFSGRPRADEAVEALRTLQRLTFKRITFGKYFVYGTRERSGDGLARHLVTTNVFLINGTADITMDLSAFAVNREMTDEAEGLLVLDRADSAAPRLEVKLPTLDDVVFIDDAADEPIPILEGEAEALALIPAALASAAGGMLAHSLTGSLPPAYRVAGTLAGGAASGAAAYVATSRFLTGIELRSGSTRAKMDVLEHIPYLMALEITDALAGGDWGENGKSAASFESFCDAEIEAALGRIFRKVGWKEVRLLR